MKLSIRKEGKIRWVTVAAIVPAAFVLWIVAFVECDAHAGLARRLAMPVAGAFFLYLIARSATSWDDVFASSGHRDTSR